MASQYSSGFFGTGVLIVSLGLALVAAGLITAFLLVPEWEVSSVGEEDYYRKIFEDQAKKTGFRLLDEEPRFDLIAYNRDLPTLYKSLKLRAPAWLLDQGRAFTISISQGAIVSNDPKSRQGRLRALISTNGNLWSIEWAAAKVNIPVHGGGASDYEPIVPSLLRGAEMTTGGKPEGGPGEVHALYLIEPSSPPQFIYALSAEFDVLAYRRVGTEKDGRRIDEGIRYALLGWLPKAAVMLGAIAIIVVRIDRRHKIYWKTGLTCSLLTLVSSLLAINMTTLSFSHIVPYVLLMICRCIFIFLLWVSAESLLLGEYGRSALNFVELVAWQPHPRGGSQLLAGGVLGLAAAGVHLLLASLPSLIPEVYPLKLSILLQNSNFDQNILYSAILLAALVVLAEGLASRIGTSFLLSLVFSILLLSIYPHWGPWFFGLACILPIACLFLISLRQFGIPGLVSATMTYFLLPLSLFAGLHWDWLPITFLTTITLQIGLFGLGGWALAKPNISEPIRLFVSYAHEDAESLAAVRRELDDLGDIYLWCDREIFAGHDYNHEIYGELMRADVFMVLVSPSMLNSDYCVGIEIRRAMKRRRQGKLLVIPVVIEPCPYHLTDLGHIRGIEVFDHDWNSVRLEIEAVIRRIANNRVRSQTPIWQS